MYLIAANALAALTAEVGSEFSHGRLRVRLDEGTLARIEELTSLKHARYAPLATALGEIALRRLEPHSRGKAKAVVTVGDGLHLGVARAFADRLRSSGSRLVNPIMFPNTLPSACAVSIGSLYGAHVCAIAIDGEEPVRQALHVSKLLLGSGSADEVLFLAFDLPSDADGLALGFLISNSPPDGPSLEVTSLDGPFECHEKMAGVVLAECLARKLASGTDEDERRIVYADARQGLRVRLHRGTTSAQ